ncbi:hypothetical protein [Methylocystis iwaonis]|uniref:DUF2946 domain-containing protein n=1 Tax=Methylocystis iwaonis TaxID=2885079 RepID=A0ABM8EEL9_9HYPH|nr:hypothetical protein [Methylocystis iwaonis]BDV36440.1 hypothetical protein SS37A_39700 [Methylocystis iwaonis]
MTAEVAPVSTGGMASFWAHHGRLRSALAAGAAAWLLLLQLFLAVVAEAHALRIGSADVAVAAAGQDCSAPSGDREPRNHADGHGHCVLCRICPHQDTADADPIAFFHYVIAFLYPGASGEPVFSRNRLPPPEGTGGSRVFSSRAPPPAA